MQSLGSVETDDFIDENLSRPLQIIYQDENLVAVFKPAGLIVHRSSSTKAHEPVLLQTLRDQLQTHIYPVHRLDRPTAGLILFGLNKDSAAKMVDLFTRRMVSKYYQALVIGLAPDSGSIATPLSNLLDDDRTQVEPTDWSTQAAETHFQTLRRFQVPIANMASKSALFSLLEIQPKTGRSHQIRRHLNEIGHAILGDHRHGDLIQNRLVLEETGVVRMLLTSMRLDFRHPYSGELHSIVAGRGSEFDHVVDKLEPYRIVKQHGIPPATGCLFEFQA